MASVYPTIARWNGADNLAEKYHSFSPYHYAGNNPISNIDLDGNEFTEDAWKYANRLVSEINSRQDRNNDKIKSKQAELAEGGLSSRQERRLNRQIDRLEDNNQELEGIRGEIATLEASDQIYNVVESSSQNENGPIPGLDTKVAHTSFNFDSGNVDITISSNAGLGMFAHELLHAYQFETGQISLGDASSPVGYSFLLDKTDELAGYTRQGLFGSNQGVTSTSTLPERYSSLPSGPVNIHNLSPSVSSAIQLKNSMFLKQLAKQRNQAFRINGKTYSPKQLDYA